MLFVINNRFGNTVIERKAHERLESNEYGTKGRQANSREGAWLRKDRRVVLPSERLGGRAASPWHRIRAARMGAVVLEGNCGVAGGQCSIANS
jgi:hypothetical protein